MDIASIAGLGTTVFMVIFGIIVTGLGAGDIVDIPSVLITVGGSVGATLMANPLSRTVGIGKVFQKIFNVPNFNVKEKIIQIVSFSEKARRDGLLALEDDMDRLDDKFLKKALQLVVDGTDPEIVRNVMQIELDSLAERHGKNRAWFETIGELGPAFGMLGTLIGLVGMLQNLGGDATAIGKGMAAALITTLYGSILANMFAIPTATKLKNLTDDEILVKQVLLEGTLSIQAGDNPRIVQEKLASYLDPAAREEIAQKDKE